MMGGRSASLLLAAVALALGAVAWLLLSDSPHAVTGSSDTHGDGAAVAAPEEAVGGPEGAAQLATGSGEPKKPAVVEDAVAKPTCTKAEGVFGRVIDGREKPIGGATVRLFVLDPQMPWGAADGAPLATATSDALGTFLVGPAPAEGRMKVKADAPGYASNAVYVMSRGSKVDLILDLGGAVRVRVKDEAGAAVKGAEVRYMGGMVTTSVETSESGEAVLDALPTGPCQVRVRKVGYASAMVSDLVIAAGSTLDKTCVLMRGVTIAGRVADEADKAVPGAEVTARSQWDASAPGTAAVTTGEDGRFTVPSAGAAGEWIQVFAKKEGYVPGTTQVMLQQAAGPGGQEIVLKVSKERLIVGRVEDSDGKPVSGATVLYPNQFQRGAGGGPSATATTSVDGHFTIGLPPGAQPDGNVFLAARAAGRGLGTLSVKVPKADARPPEVVIQLMGAGSVGGTVTGADSQPLEGATVTMNVDWNERQVQSVSGAVQTPMNWMTMQATQDARLITLATATDAAGTWRLSDVPAGTYMVSVTWGLDRAQATETVTVRGGASETVNVTIGGGQTAEGRVIDTAGAPVVAAQIRAWDPNIRTGQNRWANARSDSEGRWVLRGMTGTTPWQASVYAAGYAALTVPTLRAGDKDVEMKLTALGWVVGFVLADHAPYGGSFTVSAQSSDEGGNARGVNNGMVTYIDSGRGMRMGGGGGASQEFTSADGSFTLRGLAAGVYKLSVTTKDGWIAMSPVEVTVVDGKESGPVEIRLTRGASLSGTVTDEVTRETFTNAYVAVQLRQGNGTLAGATSASQTDAKGRYAMQGLAPGTYVVSVRPPTGVAFDEEVRLEQGQATVRDLVVPRGGAIRVHVTDAVGVAVAGARITIKSANGMVIQLNWQQLQREGRIDFNKPNAWELANGTDAGGIHERTQVPPGRVQVEVNPKDSAFTAAPVWAEIAPDRTTDVSVTVQQQQPPGDGK